MDAAAITHALGGHWKNGRGSAPCPICQTERRRDQTALSITESGGRLLLHCFKSGCHFRDIADAARVPLNRAQVDPEAERERETKRKEYDALKLAKARALWDASVPIRGTKAEHYLRGRGISCELPPSLRFVPDLHHAPSMTWCYAMVAKVEPTGGCHRTFLTKKGERLQKSAKMMLGACAGGAVRLSDTEGPIVVCEGIETGLSLLSGLLDRPATVWASLSTSGMKSLRLPDRASDLIIATDGDDAGREAGHKLAKRASLQGWRVSMMTAPDGKDFNDILQEGGTV
ncbi:toprim domain-containing protein [Ruegeria sp. 2205SS24-7]|uniref:toprim domain-containing protein n=1 Tax=Ruegeria discodermiae TaxID=3064389 RepID=UPI002742552B|nr:toprim domain-containing protein [Ruegeria sp. 2205SS24-7]MDP5217146.1 toprim domain-containing protein [Ruegeria sp. 2205SS24-7]